MQQAHHWWQTGVIYQIYPRSFLDSNGDGVGDLPGITSKLDYLQWLGIDALWLSPIYPSPMADFGYDIANYMDIDALFGSLDNFTTLLQQAHQRNLKVLLDFVPNHTSDEHAWFVESRSNRTNAKRDWYIWRDPAPGGGPPNNWDSYFGGPAWTFDATTGQYYLHLFDTKQPDLNWRNPQVRDAMYAVMRFWLERGVDGFRVDVLWLLIKDTRLRDNPPNPHWQPGGLPWARQLRLYSEDQPEVHEIVRAMRSLTDEYNERVLIGEIYLPLLDLLRYYGGTLDEAHLPFNFQLVTLPQWDAHTVQLTVDVYEMALPAGAWPNWVLGNHDKPRIASRVGPAQARIAHMLLLTLRGTPTCYYGDEIAMHDVAIPEHLTQDPQGLRSPGYSRDPIRTPMQWDASTYANFSSATPWLPLADDYAVTNVAIEENDPTSMLTLFRRLIALRHELPVLKTGSYRSLEAGSATVFAYLRENQEQRVLIVLNFVPSLQQLDLSVAGSSGSIRCSTYLDLQGHVDLAQLTLRPDEGLLIQLA